MDGGIERTVTRLNIEQYKKLLESETDEQKRQILLRLLAEEEAKLRSLTEAHAGKRQA
jgi:alkylation response protein AidB-like acyl-CoA dehydrogenase